MWAERKTEGWAEISEINLSTERQNTLLRSAHNVLCRKMMPRARRITAFTSVRCLPYLTEGHFTARFYCKCAVCLSRASVRPSVCHITRLNVVRQTISTPVSAAVKFTLHWHFRPRKIFIVVHLQLGKLWAVAWNIYRRLRSAAQVEVSALKPGNVLYQTYPQALAPRIYNVVRWAQTVKRGFHATERTQRTQRNKRDKRNDSFYPCVLAVASAAFAAYFLASLRALRWMETTRHLRTAC